MTPKRAFFISILLYAIYILVLSSCTGAKYGRLTSTPDIKRSFESYEVLPNHKYYFRGAKSKPYVIVGINEKYELNLKLWVPLNPESEDFRVLIDRVSLQGSGGHIQPWGFRILDNAGNDVGVWYSAIRAAAGNINEDRQIVKLQPVERLVAVGDQTR